MIQAISYYEAAVRAGHSVLRYVYEDKIIFVSSLIN